MATKNLPALQYPSRADGVRGMSRDGLGSRAASRQNISMTFGQEMDKNRQDAFRPRTADQIPWRLTKSSGGNGERSPRGDVFLTALGGIPEGVEVKRADDLSKPRIPIFGNRADMASRAESRQSRLNTASSSSGTDRASVDELELLLREKIKTGYYGIKNAFKQSDPEGKGVVNRECLARIVSNFVNKSVSLSQFNRLMYRLHLENKKMISYDEFYASLRPPKKVEEGPAWLELEKPERKTMNASQVHAHLKEKAKQRFLDLAELIPQMNPGGTGRLLRPELRNVLNKMGFFMEDEEFEKLWLKYDTENIGTIRAEQLLGKLGIVWNNADSRHQSRPPRKLETERKQQLDVERWLKNKFREGFSDMKHAFMELDQNKTGRISRSQFRQVLVDFDLHLDNDKQLEDFLARCGIPANGSISYKEFLRRFQDRSEAGIPHKILANPLHRYHHSDVGSTFTTTSAVEAKLLDMFQNDFLALLGTFHNIDRRDSGLLTQQQFRAAIEGRFDLNMSDADFDLLLTKVPLDHDGMVRYVEFMSKFDTTDDKSLFDKSSMAEMLRTPSAVVPRVTPPKSLRKGRSRAANTADTYDSQEGRSVEELKKVIREALSKSDLQTLEEAFYELDEWNSKKLTQDMMKTLLQRFDVNLSRNEVKRLWDTFITDNKGHLEYWQFVRHFGRSIGSGLAFPNSKLAPPKRGDNDFMMRSNKLNSAVDMLYDQLKSKIDFYWERLQNEFIELDKTGSGTIDKENFKEVLQSLCLELTDYEANLVCAKFDTKKDGRISYVKFLEPFAKRRRAYRHGHNMQAIMNHPLAELPMDDVVQKPGKGLSEVTSKLRQKLSGDWKNLRRAFRKLDLTNDGFLTIPEFRSVLRLCNVVLDEEEIYHLLSELDQNVDGKISYDEFIKKMSR